MPQVNKTMQAIPDLRAKFDPNKISLTFTASKNGLHALRIHDTSQVGNPGSLVYNLKNIN